MKDKGINKYIIVGNCIQRHRKMTILKPNVPFVSAHPSPF